MPVRSSSSSIRGIVFVKIELDGVTLRYASEDISAKDVDGTTYFWEGRVLEISRLYSGFNDFKESSPTVTSMSISLANGKKTSSSSTLDTYADTYFWGLRTCTVYLQQSTTQANAAATGNLFVGPGQTMGPGKYTGSNLRISTSQVFDLSTSEVIMKGVVSFPNSLDTFSDLQIDFKVLDQRYTDQLLVAPNVFKQADQTDNTTFANLNVGVEGRTVPVIYGDFSDAFQIPAFPVIGGKYSVNRTFKLADQSNLATGQSALHSIQALAIGAAARATTTTDLSNGNFTLADVVLLDTGAEVYAACKGKTRGTAIAALFGGSSSSLLEHPVEVLYDLLVNRLGVSTNFVDTASFTTLYTDDTTLRCRRYLAREETIVSEINAICFEFGFELYQIFGSFKVKKFSVTGTSVNSFTQDHMDLRSYQTQIDPNRSYFNAVTMRFAYSPLYSDYVKVSRLQNYAKIAAHGKTQEVLLTFAWAFQEINLIERFGWLLYLYSRPIRVVNAKFRSKAWDLEPTQVFNFTYHIYNAQKLLCRNVTKNLMDYSTTVTAWDLGTIRNRTWAANADTAPTTYANCVAAAFAVYHAESTITTGFNDTLTFVTDSTYTATVTAGNYATAALLATAMQTAMNAVSLTAPVTVTYSTTTRKFTLSRNGGGTFSLNFLTTPEIGRSVLAFDISSNKTGASTYTSDNVAIFDLSDGEAASQWV